jgi:ribonucleoside-diphosphate reductase alpha chain/ribonucleoside-triphosphate reductase
MRIGIGITGYLQATEEQREWLPYAYTYVRSLDKEYSQKHDIPESIKLTTVKPSGTLSLLGNCTSGIHPAYSQYYIRRVRFSSDSPLLKIAEDNGYYTEYVRRFDGSEQHDTKIVEFPCETPEGTLLAKDCTAIEQLINWK